MNNNKYRGKLMKAKTSNILLKIEYIENKKEQPNPKGSDCSQLAALTISKLN